MIKRLGPKFEEVPLEKDSAFVKPRSLFYELDGADRGGDGGGREEEQGLVGQGQGQVGGAAGAGGRCSRGRNAAGGQAWTSVSSVSGQDSGRTVQDRGRTGAGQAQDRGGQGQYSRAREGPGLDQAVRQPVWLGGLYLPKATHPFCNAKGWQTQTLWMACAAVHLADGARSATCIRIQQCVWGLW